MRLPICERQSRRLSALAHCSARRAVAGMKQQIRIDAQGRPIVTGTSKGTDPGTLEQYAAVQLGEDIHYGVGAAILALIETSGLPE